MLRRSIAVLLVAVACAIATDAAAQSNLSAQVTGNVVVLSWSGTAQNWRIEAGTVQGTYPTQALTGSAAPGFVASGVPNGTYYIRVRAVNNGTPANTASSPITVNVGPPRPTLSRSVSGNTINLSWTTTAPAWVLEAGSATGLSDIAVVGLGPANTFSASAIPPGSYYLRVRPNFGGTLGGASNEVVANVTTCIGTFRTDLRSLVSGTSLALNWSILGSAPTGWRLEAGTATGSSNIATIQLPGTQLSLGAALGAGSYFIRLRRNDSCGGVSNEVQVQVPAVAQCPVPVPSELAVQPLATITLPITLDPSCSWVAETSDQWITLLNTQGVGSVTFRFSTTNPTNPPLPAGTTGEIRFRTKNGRYTMRVVRQ